MRNPLSCRSVILSALLLSACDGRGGDPIAAPEDLRLSIIRGRQQTGLVKPAGAPLSLASGGGSAQAVPPNEVLAEPVVVRVSIVGGSQSIGAGATGPSLTSIPSGAIVNWRIIGEGCGQPFAAITALEASDTVVNYWRRGTKAGTECKMVAEGVAGGQPFGSDTARATFTAGAPSLTYDTGISSIAPFPRTVGANAVQDSHGNAVAFRVEGDANFSVAGTEAGTAEARTVTFLGTVDPSVNQRFILRLLDASAAHVGKLLVVVQGDGLGFWQAAGLSVPLS